MRTFVENLVGGDRRSLGEARFVGQKVLDRRSRLPELLDCLEMDEPVVRSRAAHALTDVVQAQPGWVDPHVSRLLRRVAEVDQWEVRSQFCLMFPHFRKTAARSRRIQELLEIYLLDRSSIVRTFAMQAMVDLAIGNPKRESRVADRIESLMDDGTAAMRARGRMLLKQLRRRSGEPD